ncbi:6-bladed beta-propeller [uncultured Bacteroides sp.]|uniref:6-bladed beta-propeller n=1 Tax=uncultured Bacteroides sp. TaxID=162156 RepID=UPI0025EFA87B|nr:6-bladed beta-propeller [uncultured Bacteroides sp.]
MTKKTIHTLILTILSLLITGCATSHYGDEPTITLQVNEKSITDTAFLYAPRTIRLETNNETLITRINKVIEWNRTLYVLDRRGNQLIAFDADGRHKYTIHRVGSGRGEYSAIIDAAINKKKNELVLLTDPSALLSFDSKGRFVGSQKLPAYYNSISIDGDYIYLGNATYANNRPTKYSITILHNGHSTEILEPLKELAPYCTTEGRLLGGASPTLFTRKFDPTIYKITKEEIAPLYRIDFSKETFPEDAKNKVYDCRELNRYTIRNRLVYLMTDVVDAKKTLLFKTNLPGSTYILSKADSTLSEYNVVYNSQYKFPLPKYTSTTGEEDAVCFIVPASSLINLKVVSDKNPNAKAISQELKELVGNIKDDDNPILFLYKLK